MLETIEFKALQFPKPGYTYPEIIIAAYDSLHDECLDCTSVSLFCEVPGDVAASFVERKTNQFKNEIMGLFHA